ncbi:SDR family oxidoreductase [Streptomyces albus subsp. chlorinus]|uniref:SDR family oxidoreductase n=1 Tax=Streptomyces albus TaxID=1888 RepID=UPI00156E9653|nr:SDR family oxidoreductase [Streptomyces albus]NSC23852.1 SDR family oxidoreductase [Streptomyces albus subsp. chlorinus]
MTVAVVTGGTRGVGAGIARAFLRGGAEVVVCARRPPAVPLTADGRRARYLPLDVRDPEAAHAFCARVAEEAGSLDVLVNNAGGTPYRPLAEGAAHQHARVVELNLLAPLHVSRAAHAVMRRQPRGGSIVMVGSVSGGRPSPGTAAYGAAKAGLESLAGSMAVEWARDGVRVNTVVLGMARTERTGAHYGDAAGVAAVSATVPLGRLAEPDEVGDACVFLASDAARYISGASLAVHGGGERPAFLDAANVNKDTGADPGKSTGEDADGDPGADRGGDRDP